MKRAIWTFCFALVTAPLLLAQPAAAACSDRPAAGVDWSKCEKRRLILRDRDLSNGVFQRTDFGRSDLAGVKLVGADLTEAGLEHARLAGADLSGAILTKANGDRANFTGAILKGADLGKAEMSRTDFTGADFTGAVMEKAELGRAILAGSRLDGADLSRAEVARAVFAGASLVGTDMTGAYTYLARFEATDLSRVKGLTQRQLDDACGDTGTVLPEGLTAPASWPCAQE
ncbi:MAG: pentapeptide repeat-containing protein [Kiloniellaceae bacterium]